MITNYASNCAVEPPLFYFDENGKECEFNKIENDTKERIVSLLQFTSPFADLCNTAVFTTYDCEGTILKILNFTHYIISFNEKRELSVNNTPSVVEYSPDNGLLIIYPIRGDSSFICVEDTNDDKTDVSRYCIVNMFKYICEDKRCTEEALLNSDRKEVILPLIDCFGFVDIFSLEKGFARSSDKGFKRSPEPFLSQHSFKIIDKEELIKKNNDLLDLMWQIPEKASLKPNLEFLHFISRNNSQTATILNHTRFHIDFNLEENLRIEGLSFKKLTFNNSLYVAYHVNEANDVICFEQKIPGVTEIGKRFFWIQGKGYTEQLDKPEIVSGGLKLEKAFKVYSLLHCDPNSSFAENNIPSDIKNEIVKHYIFS